jgi:sugar O-acyltransferase (sialic acid O-acetyltransferase NeuD family)
MTKQNKENNIVIIGASGHAKVVIDVIEHHGLYRIAGLIDDFKPAGQMVYGYTILGPSKNLAETVKNLHLYGGFIAVGDNWTRQKVVKQVNTLLPDFIFINAIHPGAILGRGASIGRGSVVMAGAVVNSDSNVGDFCIINTNASLDHDGLMEDFSSLAPGVITGGNVHIGSFSAVGLGAGILEGRKVGKQTVVGAGALVVKDLPDFCVAYGIQARVIRSRKEGEHYLSSGEKPSRG